MPLKQPFFLPLTLPRDKHLCLLYMATTLLPDLHTRKAVPDRTSVPDDSILQVPDSLPRASFSNGSVRIPLLDEAGPQDAVFSFCICHCMHRRCLFLWTQMPLRFLQDASLRVHPEFCAMASRLLPVWKVLSSLV